MEKSSVSNFREYLKINTMQPNPDYDSCTKWLKTQAEELGASFSVTECVPNKPIVLMTIEGTDPSLQSLYLNSHTDVVPVYPEHWKYDPFSAHKDEKGNIYARGSQDMKCVGVQYMEAMKELQKEGVRLKRTVHISFVPDEEIGGLTGLKKFVRTEEFKKLNVGLALDEGYANPEEEMFVFYGERANWAVEINCPGQPGHGSQFLPDNAAKKVQKVINFFMGIRDSEERRLRITPNISLGDVITTNLTVLQGGVQFNVVPSEIKAVFDVRIPPTVDLDKFEQEIKNCCEEAGEGISINFQVKNTIQAITCVEDGKSKWWDAFRSAIEKENLKYKKQIFPGATDGRYIREVGIDVFCFSPMNFTERLLHDHNEYLNENTFLRGIEIYKTILKQIGNV